MTTSVVMVTTGAPVFMLVIAVPAVLLLMAAGPGLVAVALIPAAEGRWVLVGGVVMLPGAHARRFPTCGQPLRRGEAAVELLHVVLPHVHLEKKGKRRE